MVVTLIAVLGALASAGFFMLKRDPGADGTPTSPADRDRVIQQTLENLALCGREHEPALRDFCEAEAARAERAGVRVDHGRAAAWRPSAR